MKEIKHIAEYIREELADAEKYAKAAMKCKDTDRDLAQTYHDLSRQELTHIDLLHSNVARLIKEHTAKGKEVPAAMQAVWDWEHEHMVEEVKEVKLLLDMFRS